MTITAPYDARALETVKATHRQEFYAEATTAAGVTHRLQVSDATVSFSEDYSPRVQAVMSCANNLAPAVLAELDPRAGLVLGLYAGYIYPGAESDVQLLAELVASTRGASQPGDVLELVGASAEVRAHEVKWLQAAQVKTFAGVVEAVQWLADYSLAPAVAELVATVPAGYRPDLVAAVALEPGLALWDVMHALSASAGLVLYVDAAGVWRLEPPATVLGETAAYLVPGPNAAVTKLDDVLSRDGYAEAALIRFKWKDANGDKEILGTWAPTVPGLAYGAGCKVWESERPGPITQSAANEAARLAIVQLSTRGNAYVIEATAHYWLRPGMAVQLVNAEGEVIRHICKTVTFNVAAGSMAVTTREPNNLGD